MDDHASQSNSVIQHLLVAKFHSFGTYFLKICTVATLEHNSFLMQQVVNSESLILMMNVHVIIM